MRVEQLQDAPEQLQEGHPEQFKADRDDLVVAQVAQQDLEGLLGIDCSQRLDDLLHEVDV